MRGGATVHYKIQSSKDIFATEPGLRAIPEFNACTSQELKFIFVAHDYEGPYRKLEAPKRLKASAIAAKYKWQEGQGVFDKAGIDAITFKSIRMKKARDYFMDVVQADDLDLAMLTAYNEQIREYTEILRAKEKKPSETKLAMEIQKKLPEIIETRNKLAEICGHKADFVTEIQTKKKWSTVDKINAGLIEVDWDKQEENDR